MPRFDMHVNQEDVDRIRQRLNQLEIEAIAAVETRPEIQAEAYKDEVENAILDQRYTFTPHSPAYAAYKRRRYPAVAHMFWKMDGNVQSNLSVRRMVGTIRGFAAGIFPGTEVYSYDQKYRDVFMYGRAVEMGYAPNGLPPRPLFAWVLRDLLPLFLTSLVSVSRQMQRVWGR